jgi:hypothetical protein
VVSTVYRLPVGGQGNFMDMALVDDSGKIIRGSATPRNKQFKASTSPVVTL